jgi:hypothetical protein
VSFEPKHLLRTLALLWARLGSLRIYFVAALAVILLLAAFGLWHLIAPATRSVASSNKTVAGISPGIPARSPSSIRNSRSSPTVPRAIIITELTEAEEKGPRGETYIVAKIGLAPRTIAKKENVEIRVVFFDVDANNEMRPTDAQVTYQWITPERDWSDPSAKYLVATYLKHQSSRRAIEPLRYGGFVVRVYSDGKLQDEHSKPETLIAALRSNTPSPTPPAEPTTSIPPSSPPSVAPSSILNPPSSFSDSLPKGIPVPGKPGFVQSPYDPKFLIDVRGFPPGTLVNDPNTNKPFRVP